MMVTNKYGTAAVTTRRNLCSRNIRRGGGHLGGVSYLPLSTTGD
jgi:hypothetical protein